MYEKVVHVNDLYAKPDASFNKSIEVSGWVRTIRTSKKFGFIELNDGTHFNNVQIVFGDELANFIEITKLSVGSSLHVKDQFVETPGAKQPFEIKANEVKIIQVSDLANPIQKKRHSLEFLRTIAHLRPRTNTFSAVFRIRSILAFAIHTFFNDRGFVYVHTPITTSVDTEGAGEMFTVSTLDPDMFEKPIDYSKELLGQKTFLTVSGQLPVESFCMGFRNVYTFGPTFRAENSNTPYHACEFWMIEPEIAFADLDDDMDLAEEMMKFILQYVLDHAPEEMAFLNRIIDRELIGRLDHILNSDFARITYSDAIDRLQKAKQDFEYPTDWGDNLQREHERYLSEQVFKKPVFVTDYPKEIKAFYMRLNDDEKTVRAMDLLVLQVGEIIGGSQREDRYEVLLSRIHEEELQEETYDWYLDLRKYGSFPHAGFGLGFARALMYITGMKNIRDVIPFPRTPKNVSF